MSNGYQDYTKLKDNQWRHPSPSESPALMNDRIEQYVKQYHCEDYFNSYGESVADPHYFMYREEVDGLIELIVKECALIAGLMEFENRKNIGAAILDRFGVNDDKDSIE